MSVSIEPAKVVIAAKPTTKVLEQNNSLTLQEEIIRITAVAAQGPAGVAGQQDKNFTQAIDSANPVIYHNLAKRPAVTVIETSGDEVEGKVTHLDINSLTIQFSAPVTGIVICN